LDQDRARITIAAAALVRSGAALEDSLCLGVETMRINGNGGGGGGGGA